MHCNGLGSFKKIELNNINFYYYLVICIMLKPWNVELVNLIKQILYEYFILSRYSHNIIAYS